MTQQSSLRLATRGSALALAQARLVAALLEKAHRRIRLRVELVQLTATGDRDRTTPLHAFGGAGVFVKELEQALRDGRADCAVHSLKDLPVALPDGLVLAAVGPREDVRDVAVLRGARSLAQLPAGALIGSGSPRRREQLRPFFPHLRFAEIRGNVATRLRKVAAGEYHGTVLALAGLRRLGVTFSAARLAWADLPGLHAEVLPLRVMLPAPGQGALALEARASDTRTRRLLAALNRADVAACVRAERACLAALGGGCHLPLGAYAQIVRGSGRLRLRAVLASPDGRQITWAEASGSARTPEALGRRVARMLESEQDQEEE